MLRSIDCAALRRYKVRQLAVAIPHPTEGAMKESRISGIFSTLLVSLVWSRVECSGCSKSFLSTELQKSRLEQIKGNILAQLGSFEPARADAALPSIEEQRKQNETIARYHELIQQGIPPEPKCVSEEFYAKPVTTFTGVMSLNEGKILRIITHAL